jgi:hypothetical protein
MSVTCLENYTLLVDKRQLSAAPDKQGIVASSGEASVSKP